METSRLSPNFRISHASVMVAQALRTTNGHAHLLGVVALFGIIGIVLIALVPGKVGERALAVA